ncbi:MAG: hypothetical protein KTR31_40095 [Myxococcales bacterium]|nr:hypothetical protein [Myxococcales bacterium]
MPKQVNEFDVAKLERLLRQQNLDHLAVRKHGTKLILESGPDGDRIPHARFVKDTVHLWLVDVHAGRRWERTPFRAQLGELLELLADAFPWLLVPRA